jgi:hypothetical protein
MDEKCKGEAIGGGGQRSAYYVTGRQLRALISAGLRAA